MHRVENTTHCCTSILSMGTCSVTAALYLLIPLSLPSNGSTCYSAPSLRLFVPNSLRAYHHYFFSEGCACDDCYRSRLPSPLLGSHDDCSPTVPTAPSFRPLVPSGSLIGCESVQVYYHHPTFPIGGGKSSESGQCSYISGFYSMCRLVFRFGGTDPSTMFSHSLFAIHWKTGLLVSQLPVWRPCWVFSCFPDVTALLHLGSLWRCCIPVAPDVSYWMSVLSRFLLQRFPWSAFSLFSSWPSVLYDRIPYAMQERHGWSIVLGQQPTFSGTHYCSGFVSTAVGGAILLDAGPPIGPAVLR
jgi:hypothetical protein